MVQMCCKVQQCEGLHCISCALHVKMCMRLTHVSAGANSRQQVLSMRTSLHAHGNHLAEVETSGQFMRAFTACRWQSNFVHPAMHHASHRAFNPATVHHGAQGGLLSLSCHPGSILLHGKIQVASLAACGQYVRSPGVHMLDLLTHLEGCKQSQSPLSCCHLGFARPPSIHDPIPVAARTLNRERHPHDLGHWLKHSRAELGLTVQAAGGAVRNGAVDGEDNRGAALDLQAASANLVMVSQLACPPRYPRACPAMSLTQS